MQTCWKLSKAIYPHVVFVSSEKSNYFISFESIHLLKEWWYFTTITENKNIFVCEVIPEGPQKLRFDIDHVNQISDIYEHIIAQVKDPNFILFDISSKTKKSYHIVYPTFIFPSSQHVLDYVKETIKKREIIDLGVYHKNQFFRLEGSSKVNQQDRKKWRLDSPNRFSGIFEEGLVSFLLPNSNISIPEKSFSDKMNLNHIKTYEKKKIEITFPNSKILTFGFFEKLEDLLLIKNTQGYFCYFCERNHDHENPFIRVTKNGNFFCCRRNSDSVTKVTFNLF